MKDLLDASYRSRWCHNIISPLCQDSDTRGYGAGASWWQANSFQPPRFFTLSNHALHQVGSNYLPVVSPSGQGPRWEIAHAAAKTSKNIL